ncbi:unnamed protein product [Phaeothamnion confervicola]
MTAQQLLPAREKGQHSCPKAAMKVVVANIQESKDVEKSAEAPRCDDRSAEENLVKLNVGGTRYVTTRQTLDNAGNSMLLAMFSGSFATLTDADGFAFVDRCGSRFHHVLNYLRCGSLPNFADLWRYEAIAEEADFFSLEALRQLCAKRIEDLREARERDARRSVSCRIIISEPCCRTGGTGGAAGSAGLPIDWRERFGTGVFTLDEDF